MSGNYAWVVRADTRGAAGGGHAMRSLALAEAMADYAPVIFVFDRDGADWADKIAERGVIAMPEDALGDGPWAGAVLDGYRFTEADQARWKRRCGTLVVLDDTAAPLADLVLAPGAPASARADNRIPVLAGPKFALLGPRFRAAPRPRDGTVRRILISFGLRDSAGGTVLALHAIAALAGERAETEVVVALGRDAPVLDCVRRAAAALGDRCRLELGLSDLYEHYARADLAVGAGGTGLLERLAAGLPSLTVTIAENQRAAASGFAAAGATVDAGQVGALDGADLAGMIGELVRDPQRRAGLAHNGRALVDGRGAERAAKAICALTGPRRHPCAAEARLR